MRRAVPLAVLSAVPFAEPVRSQEFSPEESRLAATAPGYFTLASVQAEAILTGPAGGVPAPVPPPMDGSVDPAALINLGKAVWTIIEANKPVVDVSTTFANALPKGVAEAGQLAGWKTPESTVYGLVAKNAYGQEVVRLRWQVLRTWGGSYKGRGRYLAAVAVRPIHVEVLWGYRLHVAAKVPEVVNSGTHADPVASMLLTLDWTIATPIKVSQAGTTYHVTGDGGFKDLAPPQRLARLDARELPAFAGALNALEPAR